MSSAIYTISSLVGNLNAYNAFFSKYDNYYVRNFKALSFCSYSFYSLKPAQ